MVQESRRRGRENQFNSLRFKARECDLVPIRELHTGPRHPKAAFKAGQMTETRLRSSSLKKPLALRGASTGELMPECSILGFEPTLRLEGGSQQLQSQEDQRKHSRQTDAILSLVQYGWGLRYTQGRPFLLAGQSHHRCPQGCSLR
jgi:hypothetical protein